MKVGFVEKADAFVIKEIKRPSITDKEVLIKVKFTGVNFADVLHIKGVSPLKPPTGIVGSECAGEVIEIGKEVANYKIGDRVLALAGNALAEYSKVEDNDRRVTKIPEDIAYEDAVSLGTQGLTAATMVYNGYKVKKGDYILVHAAAGGVGSHLISIIRYLGGIVIASTSSDEKVAYCKKLGADYVINYKNEDLLKRVLEITEGVGVHAVLDSVGKATIAASISSLRPFGVAILYGAASGRIDNFNPLQLFAKNLRIQGSALWNYMPTKEDADEYFELIFKLFKQKTINTNVSKVYAFENAEQAYEDIFSGSTIGKLLIAL